MTNVLVGSGPLALRPAANLPNIEYHDTDHNIIWRCDGVNWSVVAGSSLNANPMKGPGDLMAGGQEGVPVRIPAATADDLVLTSQASAAGGMAFKAGGGGGSLSVKVPISAAQILTLDTIPVTLVAAPGAGKALAYLGGFFKWTPVTTPYGGPDGDLFIFYEGNAATPVAAVSIHLDDFNPAVNVVLVLSSPNPMLLPISPHPISTNPGITALADCTNKGLVLFTGSDLPQNMGAVTTSSLGVGGAGYAPGDTFLVNDDSAGSVAAAQAEGAVDTVQAPYTGAITAVDQGAQTFTVAGNHTSHFSAGSSPFAVAGSTGNDGAYTCAGAALTGGDTVVTTHEAIPDPTVDGSITSAVGAVLTYHLTRGGLAYLTGVHATTVETGTGDANLTIDVTAHALGDGTLTVYVDYAIKDVS